MCSLNTVSILGALAKLWKGTISFICLSVLIEQLGSHWTDVYKILYLRIFRKYVEEIQVSVKSYKNNGTLHENLCTFMIISR